MIPQPEKGWAMNKPLCEKSLFEDDPLDRAVAIVSAMKGDIKDIETGLKLHQENLLEAQTLLQEIKDTIIAAKQPELFIESESDCDDGFGQLEDLIGPEAAQKVAEVFAGTNIYIPKNIITSQNYRAIRKEYKAGASYRELGIKYGYTETHIRNIIHRKKAEA